MSITGTLFFEESACEMDEAFDWSSSDELANDVDMLQKEPTTSDQKKMIRSTA